MLTNVVAWVGGILGVLVLGVILALVWTARRMGNVEPEWPWTSPQAAIKTPSQKNDHEPPREYETHRAA